MLAGAIGGAAGGATGAALGGGDIGRGALAGFLGGGIAGLGAGIGGPAAIIGNIVGGGVSAEVAGGDFVYGAIGGAMYTAGSAIGKSIVNGNLQNAASKQRTQIQRPNSDADRPLAAAEKSALKTNQVRIPAPDIADPKTWAGGILSIAGGVLFFVPIPGAALVGGLMIAGGLGLETWATYDAFKAGDNFSNQMGEVIKSRDSEEWNEIISSLGQ